MSRSLFALSRAARAASIPTRNLLVRPAGGVRCLASQPSKPPFDEPAGLDPNKANGMDEKHQKNHDFGKYLLTSLPKYISHYTVWKDELTIYTTPSGIIPLMTYLRDHTSCLFKACMDVTAVDYPTRSNRFEVVYNLLSIAHQSRIRVKTYADEVTPVPSVVGIWPGADWYERETWDMFGVFFVGHPDLRRILTDYGFSGHPLRKDFPLTGYTEVRYDEERGRVVYEPLQLTQAFRNFEGALSPWEQVGPGTESMPESFKIPPPPPPPAEEKK